MSNPQLQTLLPSVRIPDDMPRNLRPYVARVKRRRNGQWRYDLPRSIGGTLFLLLDGDEVVSWWVGR